MNKLFESRNGLIEGVRNWTFDKTAIDTFFFKGNPNNLKGR
jgi:hypothetical protein